MTDRVDNRLDASPIIEVKDVSVSFGDKSILRNVSFGVRRGEITAMLGKSGCGKTTLFKVMLGLLAPETGTVVVDGRQTEFGRGGLSSDVMKRVGVLFQSGALFGSMTVAENVAMPLRLHTTLSTETVEYLVAMKLRSVGLEGYGDYLPAEISGGMQKRAALARATALDPAILLFDEPSAGLDPVTSAHLDRLILRIVKSLRTTVVLVTHEMSSVMAIADRAVMLDADERTIIADGPPARLKETAEDPRVREFFHRSSVLEA